MNKVVCRYMWGEITPDGTLHECVVREPRGHGGDHLCGCGTTLQQRGRPLPQNMVRPVFRQNEPLLVPNPNMYRFANADDNVPYRFLYQQPIIVDLDGAPPAYVAIDDEVAANVDDDLAPPF